MSGFKDEEVRDLLVKTHRRCCICHRFAGVKIETHHMKPKADGGDDTINNAIPVCFECHAEIESYNPKHPRGRKFTPEELRKHKEQWLRLCQERPEVLLNTPRNADVGPLQALVDELEFNLAVAKQVDSGNWGCVFQDRQFLRAISEGMMSALMDDLKKCLTDAYAAMGNANHYLEAWRKQDNVIRAGGHLETEAKDQLTRAVEPIRKAHDEILRFLGRAW